MRASESLSVARPRKPISETTSSIYKGADGSWHARVVVGLGQDGRAHRKHLRRKVRADLVKAVRALETARDLGEYQWTEDDPRVQDWFQHWLTRIQPMSARRKTLATYESQMRLHLLPTLGHLRLSELRPEHLENLYTALLSAGRSVHTVRAVHRVARSSLNEAVRRRRLVHNPALVARPPRVSEPEVDPLTIDECRQVLAAAQGLPNAPRWSLALALGLRQGEALGLMWSDLDLAGGTVNIRRSVQRWTWRHGCPSIYGHPSCGRSRGGSCPDRTDGGLVLIEPKTKASRRTIVLPSALRDELRAHRARQAEDRLKAGPYWNDDHDLVFATPEGDIVDPAQDHKSWKRLLVAAGVRTVRVHDARHTAATLLLLQETDLRTVMAIMGWTELATAQRYTHAVDELRQRAAAKMGAILWPQSGS